MSTRFLSPLARALALSLVVAGVSACGPLKYELRGTEAATGADAVVTAEIQAEQNLTKLNVTASNLPPPERIKENMTTFVVWQRANSDAVWSRVGALDYSPDSRKGTLKDASVPVTAFDLQVTAETDANIASPAGELIFSQRVSK